MKRQDVLKKTLHEAMSDRAFLTMEGLSREAMRERLSRDEFTEMIYALADRTGRTGRFRVQDVLDICTGYLPELAKTPPEGWAEHCRLFLRGQLFPHLPGPSAPERWRKGRALLLQLLRGLYAGERETLPFDPAFDFRLLDENEVRKKEFTAEYAKMRRVIRSRYVYEFLRISADITDDALISHIGGVHYAALFAARQLAAAGIPVDLALLSAAAAAHDIGKLGCRPEEEQRAPHLHFYYTDYCLSRFALPGIMHIAANHSTWDLELENLSVESLLLIYADFRVRSGSRREQLRFCTLDEAFALTLEEETPDEATRRRYLRVYGKLRDFEDFLLENGVVTDLPEDFAETPRFPRAPKQRFSAFLRDEQLIDQFKFRAIDHNLRLMAHLSRHSDFSDLIDRAAGEVQWKKIRTYMTILDEYSTYMTEEQKDLALRFLYEKLTHRESDIREHAAHIMGRIVAHYREEYKKELPRTVPAPDSTGTNLYTFEKYLSLFMEPSNKYTEIHRTRITTNADFFVSTVLRGCRADYRHRYIALLEKYYHEETYDEARIILLCSIALAMEELPAPFLRTLKFFIKDVIGSYSRDVDLIALDVIDRFFAEESGLDPNTRRKTLLNLPSGALTEESLAALYLSDLKEHTSWIVKVAHIDLLLAHTDELPDLLRAALHFANLLKVSETVSVRKKAGKALLVLADRLPTDQRNDLAIALFNGLELGDYQFARFIPDCLGRLLLKLPGREFDETLVQLEHLLNTCNEKYAASALTTIAVALEHYRDYAFADEAGAAARKHRLLNLLIKGTACYEEGISQAALRILGERIFGSLFLSAEEKASVVRHSFRRLLSLLPEAKDTHGFTFYNNAAVLNKIYRFLSAYQSEGGAFAFAPPRKVAFFPGTFDPFTLGHKAIATAIRDLGYEVYLALDEFAPGKKALARVPRRNILAMTIADEEGLSLFPGEVPIHLGNAEDLQRLHRLFDGREVSLAVGSDHLKTEAHYQAPATTDSVHAFPHIVFSRASRQAHRESGEIGITGDIVRLTLRHYDEDGNAARIRESIAFDRDTEALLDPFVQRYLFTHGDHLRETSGKPPLASGEFHSACFRPCAKEVLSPLCEEMTRHGFDFARFLEYAASEDVLTVCLESGVRTRRLSAVACAQEIEPRALRTEFNSSDLAACVRKNAVGKTAVIKMFYAGRSRSNASLHELVLTELLAALAAEDYTYAVYHPLDEAGFSTSALDALAQLGFVNIAREDAPLYAVNMKEPIVLLRDAEAVIKAPFHKNPRVTKVLSDAHRRLVQTLLELYPGQLLLSPHAGILSGKIADRILAAKENGTIPDNAMIVPYGKIPDDVTLPETLTKALYAEKYYHNDLSGFTVREAIGAAPLRDQVRTLHSFGRPIVPTDDLLHLGGRLKAIAPLLREEEVATAEVVVGLLTGAAQDKAAEQSLSTTGAYFLPAVNFCLSERDSYPFLGGDRILGEDDAHGAQAIQHILPYTAGGDDTMSREGFSRYSLVCLENTVDILHVLEQEFEIVFEKKLTLRRLGAVLTKPCRPMLGAGLTYDEERAPSTYAESALRLARRLHR